MDYPGGATRSNKPAGAVGVAAFLTPCLVIAATLATVLRQLGLPVGGLSFTVVLYLVLDFLSFRFGRQQPGLTRLRLSFSSNAEALTVGTDDGATKAEQQAAGGGAPVVARSSGQAAAAAAAAAVATATAAPSSTKPVTTAAVAAAAAAAAPAASDSGLRLSMLGADIYANGDAPFEFENDFFKGRMLFLVKCNPPDPEWAAHFEGSNSNRAFEMQIQGKLKLLPKGEVFMGGELGERPKQGLVTQTVSKIVMSFAKQMVKSLHYSFGERRAPSNPLDAENPHVTFPLYRVMDWFVVTPEAKTPPSLGGALVESAEERAARRGGKSPDIVWSTDVTYTMAFHSGIVNFQDWAVTDIPGQGSLDLNTFLCKQPVSVVVYDFTAASASATAHRARDKSYMFRCTISNDSPGQIARPAPAAAAAAASVAQTTSAGAENAALSPTIASSTAASGSEKEEGALEGDAEDSASRDAAATVEAREAAVAGIFGSTDDQAPSGHDGRMSPPPRLIRFDSTGRLVQAAVSGAATSTERSYYSSYVPCVDEKEMSGKELVKSGTVLPLLMGGGVGKASLPQNISHDFLGEGHGGRVAMRKGTAMPAGVQVCKVGGSAGTFRSDYLYEGDVIVLHHPESRKFVRIGRGWALGWSSKASASKIHFVVKGIDPGRPLANGQAFCLRSRRWSDWEVGVARQASNKVGGRGVGCFNKGKRRNTTRLSLLTLVAKPWFDADKEGVIPALEAEENAITISVRGPFEDVVSAGEEDEDDDEDDDVSDAVRSEMEEEMSDSDHAEYDSDVELDRGIKSQSSISGGGISAKAGRAMQSYSASASSLSVSVPAWVEFLHRGRRQGQLAFLLAVHATPPAPAPAAMAPATSASRSSSSAALAEPPSAAATPGTAATAGSSAATGSAGAAKSLSKATAAPGAGAASGSAEAGNGDDAPVQPPSRAKPPSSAASWTCVRTGRELSGVVQAYRESVRASVAVGSWRSKPRPRVMKHMGTADQSVRLLSYEVSEMQRREASFRGSSAHHGNEAAATGAASPITPNADSDARQLEESYGTPSAVKPGDGDSSSPPQLRSPRADAAAPRSVSDNQNGTGRHPFSAQQGGATDDGSEQPRRATSAPSTPTTAAATTTAAAAAAAAAAAEAASAAVEGGRGGLSLPYRMLCELVTSPRELDRHFLSGSNASDLGVTVGPSSSPPILGSAVARCLWESHWREEWAVLFPSHVVCYMPLSKKPAWVLPLRTLHKASTVSDERCPLPGLRCLRLETVGRAHYLCFSSRTSRDNWLGEISRLSKGGVVDPPSGLELGQDPRESYVLKTTKWRMPPRLVLNARRQGFDLPEGAYQQQQQQQQQQHQQQKPLPQQQPWELSAQVLRAAFKVHADPGNKRLVPFLDLACTFRQVDPSSLDLNSNEALCFFANLYHLIVRHMLLVLGPPSSAKEWPSIYEQVSYEVGGDVFSLQELEHCVLRGRLPRPSLKDLPKRFAPLPPEGDDHYAYSLGKADARVSLFLNNGSQSNPTAVVLLSPEMLDEQLNRACQAFVDHTVKTDSKRRQILVHKVFQLYARDLQPLATSKDMVRYSLRFAGNAVIHGLSALDVDISQAHIRYHPYLLKCHETMYLLNLSATTDDAASPSQH